MDINNLSKQERDVYEPLAEEHNKRIDDENKEAAERLASEAAIPDADDPPLDEKTRKEMIIKHLQDHSDALYPLLVRGAVLRCRMGSHRRKLNLPFSHGIWTGEAKHPFVHEEDAVFDKNIMYFGHCKGTINKSGVAEEIDLEMVTYDEEHNAKPTGAVTRAYKCKPQIIGGCWSMTHKETKILKNGRPMSEENAAECVTGASFLVCIFGGLIEPLTDGTENKDTKPIG